MIKQRVLLIIFLMMALEQLPAQNRGDIPQSTKITLTVKNPERRVVVIETNRFNLSMKHSKPDQRKITLDANNTASTNIFLNEPAYIKVMDVWKDSSMDFLLVPGRDFSIEFDARNRKFVKYGNDWEKLNAFHKFMVEDCRKRLESIPENDPELFVAEWEKQSADNFKLALAANKDGIDPQFSAWVLQSVNSLYYSTLISQLVNYITIKGAWPLNMNDYMSCCKSFNNVHLNNAFYFTSEYDKDWVEKYYLFETVCNLYKEDSVNVPSLEIIYKNAIEKALKIEDAGVKKVMIQYMVKSVVKQTSDTGFLNWAKNALKEHVELNYLNALVNTRIQLLNTVPVGKPAIVFDASDKDGGSFLFSKYSGKYIYMDVWATWCIPCKRQIPFMERLKKKYEGKPIAFVSISIDRSNDDWKGFILKDSDTEDQYISNPGLKRSISNTYRVQFIPAFVLIDPEGNIVKTDCYSPSDPAMDLLLEKILN